MNRIQEILDKRGLEREDLHRMTGIALSTLSRIINEEKGINLTTAKKIAKALVFPIEYIWPD